MGYFAFFLLLTAACLLWSAACTAAVPDHSGSSYVITERNVLPPSCGASELGDRHSG